MIMKTLIFTLSILTLNAEAAIPKRGDLVSQSWCTKRVAEERTDRIMFKMDGKVAIHTFHSTGDIEEVKNGTWKLDRDKLKITLDNRPSNLSVSVVDEGRALEFSTGTKAVACN